MLKSDFKYKVSLMIEGSPGNAVVAEIYDTGLWLQIMTIINNQQAAVAQATGQNKPAETTKPAETPSNG